ncbi:MAG: hypothetical protein EZS28_020407, partial [Streblomastix strix]
MNSDIFQKSFIDEIQRLMTLTPKEFLLHQLQFARMMESLDLQSIEDEYTDILRELRSVTVAEIQAKQHDLFFKIANDPSAAQNLPEMLQKITEVTANLGQRPFISHLIERYDAWITENEGKINEDDKANCINQREMLKKIIELIDSNLAPPDKYNQIYAALNELRKYGCAPQDLVKTVVPPKEMEYYGSFVRGNLPFTPPLLVPISQQEEGNDVNQNEKEKENKKKGDNNNKKDNKDNKQMDKDNYKDEKGRISSGNDESPQKSDHYQNLRTKMGLNSTSNSSQDTLGTGSSSLSKESQQFLEDEYDEDEDEYESGDEYEYDDEYVDEDIDADEEVREEQMKG